MMVQSQCRTCFEPVLKERFVIFLSTCTFDLKESPPPSFIKAATFVCSGVFYLPTPVQFL